MDQVDNVRTILLRIASAFRTPRPLETSEEQQNASDLLLLLRDDVQAGSCVVIFSLMETTSVQRHLAPFLAANPRHAAAPVVLEILFLLSSYVGRVNAAGASQDPLTLCQCLFRLKRALSSRALVGSLLRMVPGSAQAEAQAVGTVRNLLELRDAYSFGSGSSRAEKHLNSGFVQALADGRFLSFVTVALAQGTARDPLVRLLASLVGDVSAEREAPGAVAASSRGLVSRENQRLRGAFSVPLHTGSSVVTRSPVDAPLDSIGGKRGRASCRPQQSARAAALQPAVHDLLIGWAREFLRAAFPRIDWRSPDAVAAARCLNFFLPLAADDPQLHRAAASSLLLPEVVRHLQQSLYSSALERRRGAVALQIRTQGLLFRFVSALAGGELAGAASWYALFLTKDADWIAFLRQQLQAAPAGSADCGLLVRCVLHFLSLFDIAEAAGALQSEGARHCMKRHFLREGFVSCLLRALTRSGEKGLLPLLQNTLSMAPELLLAPSVMRRISLLGRESRLEGPLFRQLEASFLAFLNGDPKSVVAAFYPWSQRRVLGASPGEDADGPVDGPADELADWPASDPDCADELADAPTAPCGALPGQAAGTEPPKGLPELCPSTILFDDD